MRLTLRTLLAYLDESLEPADAAEIGKKIEASEFASDLVQRIRATITRPRLGAPKLFGKGLALDPNSVAEYLDSVLPPDRVGEFEKICLESDVHLAEAGACHQVLTLVFVEPAPTELVDRDRLYRLKELADSKRVMAIEEPEGPPLVSPLVAAGAVAGGNLQAAKPVEATPTTSPAAVVAELPGKAPGKNGVHVRKGAQPRVTEHFVGAPLASDVEESSASDYDIEEELSPKRRRFSEAAESNERSIWPVVGMLAAGFFIALIGLRAMGPFNNSHPLVRLFDGKAATNQPLASSTSASDKAAAAASRKTAKRTNPAKSAKTPSVETSSDAGGETATQPDSDAASAAVEGEAVAAAPTASSSDPATSVAATGASAAIGDGAAAASGDAPAADEPADEEAPPPILMGVDLGFAAAEKQLLVRYDEGAANWLRVVDKTAIRSGDHLAALPSYRPALLVNAGLAIELIGPASCRIDARAGGTAPPVATASPAAAEAEAPADAASPAATESEAIIPEAPATEGAVAETAAAPGPAAPPAFAGAIRFTLSDGAAFITTPADRPQAGGPLQVNLAGRTGWLVFENVDSRAAVSVQHTFVPGADPEKEASPLLVEVYALAGALQWLPIIDGSPESEVPPAAEAIAINPGEKLVFENALPLRREPAPTSPAWVVPSDGPAVALTASNLESLVPADRSAVLSLLELVGYRQFDVSALATRSLGYLDQFEPFVDALGNKDQKSNWDDMLAALRQAFARGPETARSVRLALERRRMDDAPKLYRFLRGYNAVQLTAPAEIDGSGEITGAAELVRGLENENLDVRVLALENLREITGRTHTYQPDKNMSQRQTALNRWRASLEDGQIRYPDAPKPTGSGGKSRATAPKTP